MIISFFEQKGGDFSREGDYLRKVIILFQILLSESHLFYFVIKLKNNHIELTDHGLFKCSKFSSLINFHSLNRHLSVLLDHIALQLDREKIKGREDGEKSGWEAIILNISVKEGRLFEGGD